MVRSNLDAVLTRLYEEFDVPADQFLADDALTDEFVEHVYRSLGRREPDRQEVMRRLVTLRKGGRLPRLRRGQRAGSS